MTDAPTAPLLCPGGTVVCLGGGPSLTREDVEACRGRATVIAINDAHRIAPWANVLYSSDQHWWPHYRGVPEFAGLKVGIAPPLEAKPEWGLLVLRNSGEQGLDPDPTGLKHGRNSGYAAINLAVHLGATRVLLLGYDMGFDATGPSHWFGEHPRELRSTMPHTAYIAMFRALVTPLRQLGVEVINCSRRTALDVFPRRPLAEVLS